MFASHHSSEPPAAPRARPWPLTLAAGIAAAGLALPLCGCLAVAAGGVGLFVSQEFVDNAHVVHYDLPADEVWATVRARCIKIAEGDPPVLDDAARTAELSVEGGRAAVRVEALTPRRSRMLVGARKFGLNNAGLAHHVLVRLDVLTPGAGTATGPRD